MNIQQGFFEELEKMSFTTVNSNTKVLVRRGRQVTSATKRWDKPMFNQVTSNTMKIR